MRVLVVEDEPATLRQHVHVLRRRGLAVDGERTVRAAGRALGEVPYDAIVVRRRLADGDGVSLTTDVGAHVAVIVLTAGSTTDERRELLMAGVDDCVTADVGSDELALRVCKAIVRRSGAAARVRLGRVVVDRTRREVIVDDRNLDLTAQQMCVLDHLVAHRHRVVTPEELVVHCWDDRSDLFSNPVPSQITRLRAKLAGAVDIVWTGGVGYLLAVVDGCGRTPGARDLGPRPAV